MLSTKTAYYILYLLLSFSIVSCTVFERSEPEDVSYWNKEFIDSSYRLLHQDKDTTRALGYFDAAYRESKAPTAFPKAARFDLLANYYYFYTKNNEATARMIDSALACYRSNNLQEHYSRTYVGLLLFGGQIAYRLGHYHKANEYYFKAKELADAHLSPCERKSFNYSIAMLLYQQQNYTNSLHYFREAYTLQATCMPQNWAVILQQQEIQSNMGLCFIQLKQYDSALKHFDMALQIANQNKDSLGPVFMQKIRGVIAGNKAKIFMHLDKLAVAEQLSRLSIALNYRKDYEMEDAIEVKMQLAEIYDRKKDLTSMFAILKEVRDTIDHFNPSSRIEWNRLMASYYNQVNEPRPALNYFKQYTQLRDSMAVVQKLLADADVNRQLNDKEQKLQIVKLKRSRQLTLVLLIVTILISLMALAIIYLVYQNYRRNKKSLALSLELNLEIKRQKEAREKEAKQRHKLITQAVIRAQEHERSLIGLELHDNINQILTTVKLQNEMVLEGVGDSKTLLSRSMTHLQECINEIRSLSKRLSAPTLGKISLAESVKDLVNSINLTSKVNIHYHITGIDGHSLKQEVHLGLYRILQEQLNNVLKHAEATEVSVLLIQKDNHIYLSIEDNGKGFLVKRSKNGIGLMNMQTRAENLNGNLTLTSTPGNGCKVEVCIPVASDLNLTERGMQEFKTL